jgi:hypothetical protein
MTSSVRPCTRDPVANVSAVVVVAEENRAADKVLGAETQRRRFLG